MTVASANRRQAASSGLDLAHQPFAPASLPGSVFETGPGTATQDFAPREGHEEPNVSDGGRLTLGVHLQSVWEGLHAAGAAGCPVCGARMERRGAAASCGGCGSLLT
jgi:hypothetical protein